MNTLETINTHIAWKLRRQNYIEGKSAETIRAGKQCPLGQWIYSEYKTYAGYPEFGSTIREPGRAFHHLTAHIIDLVHEGNIAAAERCFTA